MIQLKQQLLHKYTTTEKLLEQTTTTATADVSDAFDDLFNS